MIHVDSLTQKWPLLPLGECAHFLDHLRRPVKSDLRKEGPYPYYGANGQQGTIDNYLFDEDLVLLAEDGGFFGQEGRTIAYRISGKTWVNNHAHVLRPKKGFSVDFLCKVLECYDVTPFITGTTRAKLNKSDASRIPIPCPPLEEQRRIAAILDKADAIRRKRQEALKLADDLVKSQFIEMFGDPVSNPKGWEHGTIRDIADDVRYGTSKPASENGKYTYLRMNNITYGGELDLSNLKFIDMPDNEAKKYIVKNGDVLFNRTNSKELVGKTCVFNADTPMVIAGYIIRVRVNQRATPTYLSAFLNSDYGKLTLHGMCKSIVGQANINAQELQNIEILEGINKRMIV